MAREFGLTVWGFGDISFEEKCRISKEIGVDGIEVQGDLAENPEELKEILKKYDLKPLNITPDNVDLSSADESVRQAAIQYFLDLLSWAKQLGAKRICIHGDVGKISGSGDLQKDWDLLVDSVKRVVEEAEIQDIELVFEVLNRYENYQVVTAEEALRLIKEINSDRLTILLDAYHMNIEESNPTEALKQAGPHLGMYHVADSNRQAVGDGHIDIEQQINALHAIDYQGPIIMEMTAAGPNPFTPVKGDNYIEVLTGYYKASLEKLKSFDHK